MDIDVREYSRMYTDLAERLERLPVAKAQREVDKAKTAAEAGFTDRWAHHAVEGRWLERLTVEACLIAVRALRLTLQAGAAGLLGNWPRYAVERLRPARVRTMTPAEAELEEIGEWVRQDEANPPERCIVKLANGTERPRNAEEIARENEWRRQRREKFEAARQAVIAEIKSKPPGPQATPAPDTGPLTNVECVWAWRTCIIPWLIELHPALFDPNAPESNWKAWYWYRLSDLADCFRVWADACRCLASIVRDTARAKTGPDNADDTTMSTGQVMSALGIRSRATLTAWKASGRLVPLSRGTYARRDVEALKGN